MTNTATANTATLRDLEDTVNANRYLSFEDYAALRAPAIEAVINDYAVKLVKAAKEEDVTKLTCPGCRERFPRIGIKKDSKIEGLTFRCRRCHTLWEVKTK